MASKEWHKNRIKELKFHKEIKTNQDNRNHITLIALLSVVVVFLSYEFSSDNVKLWGLFILYLVFVLLMWAIKREISYPEDKQIQRNFDVILGRKK